MRIEHLGLAAFVALLALGCGGNTDAASGDDSIGPAGADGAGGAAGIGADGSVGSGGSTKGTGGGSVGSGGSTKGTGGGSVGSGGSTKGTGGGSVGSGGSTNGSGGSSQGTGGNTQGTGGSSAGSGGNTQGTGGQPDAGPPPADPCVAAGTCPPNTWVNVTPPGIMIPQSGLRSVVKNPARPSDIYLGSGEAGLWKSTDYGNTWTKIHPLFGYVPQGLCIAVMPTQPPTILIGATCGCGKVHKSIDDGATFVDAGGGMPSDLYSMVVDPYDPTHLVSGFHEHDGIAESTDSGDTWHLVGTSGFPTGGVSWYPAFIDTGVANTTAKTWLAIAQNGGSPAMTHDGGATWTVPAGVTGLQHPHGNAQIFQRGGTIFVPGIYGPGGQGVFRSTDWGATFTLVSPNIAEAVAWGTPNHVYSMYAWSCFGCTIAPNFLVGSAAGDTWTNTAVPAAMLMGADHVTVTSDGTHYIFVAAMRSTGLWRYVEQ
jgi:hypothetical protein